MKSNIKKSGGLLVLAVLVLTMSACSFNTHEHTYASAWTSNAIFHWHEATCGDTTEVSEKTVHTYGSWKDGKRSCTVCSYEQTCTSHTWDTGKITTAATCAAKGVKTYTCTNCCSTKTEDVIVDHTWDNGAITTAKTCTIDGVKTYTCTVCGATKTESIPSSHTWVVSTMKTSPTCITKGQAEYTCSGCSQTKTDEVPELYSSPVDVTTRNAATSSSTYVYFGVFPQTVLASTSTVTVDETTGVTVGGNTYYKGSDGEYYAKVSANPLPDAGDGGITTYTFKYSDSTIIESGKERYFKVEPIKWKVLTTNYNSTGKALLLAENGLIANIPYYLDEKNRTIGGSEIYCSNYKYSTIRAYLNGSYETDDTQSATYNEKGFLQTAFVTTAQNQIAVTTLDNSAQSMTDATGTVNKANNSIDYTCANTQDKIFLLSEKEVTTTAYGFAVYKSYGKGNARIRFPTDYAKANYAYQCPDNSDYGGRWWLRSPRYDNNDASQVDREGDPNSETNVFQKSREVVPALTVSLQ